MLLVSSEPLPVGRIIEVIQGEDRDVEEEHIRDAITELVAAYGDTERPIGRGFRVEDVAGGLQLRTPPDTAQYIRRLLAMRPQRLSKAALETLAIVAYRQPCTKPDVEKIRGVDVGATLKALLERDLIRILGKSDEVGRPILYGTTREFLELFGLKSLAALPTLREYHELDPAHQAQVDELYEEENSPMLSDLAATAQFLVDRQHDPDLDTLDEAVKAADEVARATAEALTEKTNDEPDADDDVAEDAVADVAAIEPAAEEPPEQSAS